MCIYIYIYIHIICVYICIYIVIYIYITERERERYNSLHQIDAVAVEIKIGKGATCHLDKVGLGFSIQAAAPQPIDETCKRSEQ